MKDRDLYHLKQMYDFSKRIKRRINGVSLETFIDDVDVQDSILYAIGHLGENANAVSEETQSEFRDILWNELIGIRHRVFHSYGDISMRIIYKVATDSNPILIKQLEAIEGVK